MRARSRIGRSVLCSVAAFAAMAAVGVSSAGATITQTAITSPSNPYLYQFNNDLTPTPTQTITGTTNSTAPGSDTVDIDCYYQGDFGTPNAATIASGVPLNPDGSFSWTGSINSNNLSQIDANGLSCLLRAVPSGYGTSYPLSSFSPVFSELDYLSTNLVNGPGTPKYDYYYTGTGTTNSDDYESVGGCGLDDSFPMPSNTNFDEYANWSCAGALYNNDGSDTRSEILIGSKNAYDSASAKTAYSDGTLGENSGQAAGFPALNSSYSKDPATGNVTIHESEDLVSCADASFPATETKCGGSAGTSIGSWQNDGVAFGRTISETDGGSLVTMTDSYTSTDGYAHSIDLEYDNDSYEDNDTVWQLPGSPGYQTYVAGDQSSLSGKSSDVIYTKDGYEIDGSPDDGPGALIYNTAPNYALFSDYDELVLDYQRTVPAGGSITITQTYASAANSAELQSVVNGAVDQTVKPSVSFSYPNQGTVVHDASVQLGGHASAHDGLTLKVDGEAVGVNPDGTWSTDVSLHSGSNTITAIASDGSGNQAQATDTVIYSPTPVPAFCVVPNVSKLKLSRAKSALKKADCAVGKISKVRSAKIAKGRVEHASYSTNVVLKAHTKVGLAEVIGKPVKPKHNKKASQRRGIRRF